MSDYSLFSVMGLEIEYMLVDIPTLNVQPKSDQILNLLAGQQVNEVSLGEIAASNELVLHVLELKNSTPKALTMPIAQQFYQSILDLAPKLAEHNMQFLPTGAHPWMNPQLETHRWPHGDKSIYQKYDEIFNCEGHGWANLQSMHVNLPFASDEEFAHLHSLIRIILPLIPALAASTPILDGKPTGLLDSRLDFYNKNQQKIPSISGSIIPEFITSEAQYKSEILLPMFRDIQPWDPQGVLQYEWLNSRGAVAKFDRQSIEIRIVDSQECVQADVAIAEAIFAVLQDWYKRSQIYFDKPCDLQKLKQVYHAAIKYGLSVEIYDLELSSQWQLPHHNLTLREVWSQLIERISPTLSFESQCALEVILSQGNLSERILRALQQNASSLLDIYRQLGQNLLDNRMFKP